MIALTTNWGRSARSRELARTIGRLSIAAAAEAVEPLVPFRAGRAPQSPPQGSDWTCVSQASDWTYQSASPAPASPWTASSHGATSRDLKAKIVYEGAHPDRAWLYGVFLSMDFELPPFPQLGDEDMAILQPLPADDSLVGHGALSGRSFLEVASMPEFESFCRATMMHGPGPTSRYDLRFFRFAFYLYGRLKLVRSAAIRMMKGDSRSVLKRTADPSAMEASRCIQVPLQTLENDPNHLEPHFCDVMMVEG